MANGFIVRRGGTGGGNDNKWKQWVTAGGLSADTYESLEDVLKDEVAVRQLMTKHASADFLYSWYESEADKPVTILDAIMDSVYGAKWLGLRDYVCDKFMANATAQATMLDSENWKYILKDNVPNMTSNTAPYGTIISSGHITDYYEWYAFNRDTHSGSGGDRGYWLDSSSNEWLGYNFTNPICVKKVKYKNADNQGTINIKIEASNDNSTWTEIYAKNNIGIGEEIEDNINNANYYLYYRANLTKVSSASYIGLKFIQFYGRSLDVSVPTMTSNTAPWGEASADSVNGSNLAWKAFDNSTSDYWMANDSNEHWIAYDFGMAIKVNYIHAKIERTDTIGTYSVEASNDGTQWEEVLGQQTNNANDFFKLFSNTASYRYWRLKCKSSTTSYNTGRLQILQFFGLDYSEREDRTYIYDHGLEIMKLETGLTASHRFIFSDDFSYIQENGANGQISTKDKIDVTSFDFLCVKHTHCYGYDAQQTLQIGIANNNAQSLWNYSVSKLMLPQNESINKLNISNNSGNYYVECSYNVQNGYNYKSIVYEIWLE